MTRDLAGDGVVLSISQFRDAWRVMCGACPGMQSGAGRGVEFIFSGLPIAFFNAALVTGRELSAAALDASGRDASGWASDKGVPWLFIVTYEALATGVDAPGVLDACGLVPMIPLTGMAASQVAETANAPKDLALEVPEDDATYATLIDINSTAYAMDLDACKPVLATASFWRDHVPVLGRVGGVAASSAAVLMAGGYRYVALVATDPAYQRRGYAEAAMRHALTVAAQRHGAKLTVLHATDAGRPIYARMGYETIATHMTFIEKRFLGAH